MAKKSALGSVLDSIFDDDSDIFSDSSSGNPQAITSLKIGDVEPNKEQPRKNFDKEALNLLADSIAEHGIIQPLTVRPLSGGSYQIVAGERRWRAAKIAGLSEVPVRVMELSDEQTAQIALIENLQRENLNPIEEAMGYKQLIETYGMRQEDVAKKVGRARSSVANSLRLLELPDDIKELVSDGKISQGHCKALIAISDNERKRNLAKKVVDDGISVRTLEKLIKAENEIKPESVEKQRTKEVFLTESQICLENYLTTPVRILKSRDRITVQIEVKDDQELTNLINNITKEG